jgi:DNA polymerase-3 subunit gamma/tau
VYIVDEAHELTNPAWDAFLKTLEEPPPHAIFVLATTEAHKVPPTIVSRCQRFDFRRIPYEATRDQLARVAASEGMTVEPAVLERLALVARGGLRDAVSLLDQLGAFAAGGALDMQLARSALSLPSIEAVRGVLDGLTRRDPAFVMAVVSEIAEGGADLRLFVEELVVHLRAVLLLRSGAEARLTDELPLDEVEWLRERAPAWSIGALMRLLQVLSESLARTRDAQQFQVQCEVALLAACDLDMAAPIAVAPPAREVQERPVAVREVLITHDSADASPPRPERERGPGGEGSPSTQAIARPQVEEEPSKPEEPAPKPAHTEPTVELMRSRWPDVIDHVKGRKPILAALLSSAHPIQLEDQTLTVAFGTDFNRKRAELAANRQAIEDGIQYALGKPYRLKCTIASSGGTPSLLDDPVINFAAMKFGGEPRRISDDMISEK